LETRVGPRFQTGSKSIQNFGDKIILYPYFYFYIFNKKIHVSLYIYIYIYIKSILSNSYIHTLKKEGKIHPQTENKKPHQR
jgi:hypothetical protein